MEEETLNLGEQTSEMRQLLGRVLGQFGGGEKAFAPYTLEEREQILADHPEMLRSYTDLAVEYARQWRLDEAERVLHSAVERFGSGNAELLHHMACLRFARYDLIGAKALFDRAAQAAPNDTLIQANLNLLGAAEIDYQNHQTLAQRLFANLTSTEFLYVVDGKRELTMPCTAG
jgi:Flp pilus assembly protein TadD